jgi:hypothetical protein
MKIKKPEIKKVKFCIVRVVRRAIGKRPFMESLRINGKVTCKCGGNIISNSGRVKIDGKWLICWRCGRKVNADKAYDKRIENKTVVI